MNTIHWSGSLIVGVAILYSPEYLLEIRSSHNIVYSSSYLLFNSYCELGHAIDFLIDNIYVRFGSSVFRQVIGIPMGTNSAPLLADLFLHTFEYDFMVKTMKQDITKAIQFSNTFRYIDDLFSINNVNFGNCISAIYPSELELKDTSTSSTEVCYLDTNIKTEVKTQKKVSIAKFSKRREAMRDGCISRLIAFVRTHPNLGVPVVHSYKFSRYHGRPSISRPY